MAKCAYCGSTILIGGVRKNGQRFCNIECMKKEFDYVKSQSKQKGPKPKELKGLGCLTFLALFVIFCFIIWKIQAWTYTENYVKGDIPNKRFVVLLDIPKPDNPSKMETLLYAWSPESEKEFHKISGEWVYSRPSGKAKINADSENGFSYAVKELSNKRKRIKVSQITDDPVIVSVYDIEDNKIYPVSFTYYSGIRAGMLTLLFSLIVAVIMNWLTIRLIRRFFSGKGDVLK